MAEKSGLLYSFLNHPLGYRLKRAVLRGGVKDSPLMRYLEGELRRLESSRGRPLRILDVGCGEGAFAELASQYGAFTGIDANHDYIEFAKTKYGRFGTFICDDVRNIGRWITDPEFDVVTMKGVLHHLDDDLATDLLKFLLSLVPDEGFFVAVDPVFHDGQNPIAHFLVSRDRGQFVRQIENHQSLFPAGAARHHLTNFLNLPYSHVLSMAGNIAPPSARETRAE